MRLAETASDSPIAILAWQGQALGGYALSVYGGWACVTRFQVGGAHEFCYRAEDALVWLKQSTDADRFERVMSREDLDRRIGDLPAGGGPSIMPADLTAFMQSDEGAFVPFN